MSSSGFHTHAHAHTHVLAHTHAHTSKQIHKQNKHRTPCSCVTFFPLGFLFTPDKVTCDLGRDSGPSRWGAAMRLLGSLTGAWVTQRHLCDSTPPLATAYCVAIPGRLLDPTRPSLSRVSATNHRDSDFKVTTQRLA